MKTDIDHLMKERKLDAIFVSGSTRDNPAMYYLTNGAKIGEYSLLVKKTNEDAILIVIGMERDEASASGLQIIELSHFNLPQLLQEESGNKLVAHARMLASIFQELEIDGRIGVYGREEQGFTLALFQELESLLPALTFIGPVTFILSFLGPSVSIFTLIPFTFKITSVISSLTPGNEENS